VTWVKVCGLSREGDVAAAVEAGADAIGFVVAPGSPRRVTEARVRDLARTVPVLAVLVTVDLPPRALLAAVERTGAGGVQPHGRHRRESAAAAQQEGLFVLHPLAIRTAVDVGEVAEGQTPLLDTYRAGTHGGTGEAFDWTVIGQLDRPYVLAGGLGPDNVSEAIRRLDPWGVDASSGLESSPGVKDPELIRTFVERAKGR
jgi:phosphoribosylanthranilate isomerase